MESHQNASSSFSFVASEFQNSPISPSAPSEPPLSRSTMRFCLWSICVMGVLLNVLVFRKYRSSRCRQSHSVRSSIQLLCVMSAADTLSLLALMLALGGQHLGGGNGWVLSAICKLDLFLIHASSAFGIWCWFVLSAVRYLAIHHPYTHLRLHKEPLLSVVCVAFCCCFLEIWILFDVDFIEEAQVCGETLPEQVGRLLQLLEILWTYFLPLSLITVLDLKVLCCQSSWTNPVGSFELPSRTELLRSTTTESGLDNSNGESPLPQIASAQPSFFRTQPIRCSNGSNGIQKLSMASGSPIRVQQQNGGVSQKFSSVGVTTSLSSTNNSSLSKSRRRAQQLRILKRCLCISVIDLAMNLPNYLIRLYLTLISQETLEQIAQTETFLWLQDLSQLLYFAQFSMNALYLVAINYVLPTTQKRRHSPQQQQLAAVAICAQQKLSQQHLQSISPPSRNYGGGIDGQRARSSSSTSGGGTYGGRSL